VRWRRRRRGAQKSLAAVKVMRRDQVNQELFKTETTILRTLHHPNVVAFIECAAAAPHRAARARTQRR
jgi:hypothetical protein